MIVIDRIVPIPGHTMLLYCYDTELSVEYVISQDETIVLRDGEVLGLFPMRTMIIDYDSGYLEFHSDYDDAWFFSETYKIIHGLPKQYFYHRPYEGPRWS